MNDGTPGGLRTVTCHRNNVTVRTYLRWLYGGVGKCPSIIVIYIKLINYLIVQLSRFTGGACGHEGKLNVLIVLLSWRWDLPTPYTLVLRLSTDQG
jgi:hypothetical protein